MIPFLFLLLIASVHAGTLSCSECRNATYWEKYNRTHYIQCANEICYRTTCDENEAIGRPRHGGHRNFFVNCDAFSNITSILKHSCLTEAHYNGKSTCGTTMVLNEDDTVDDDHTFAYVSAIVVVGLCLGFLAFIFLSSTSRNQKTQKKTK